MQKTDVSQVCRLSANVFREMIYILSILRTVFAGYKTGQRNIGYAGFAAVRLALGNVSTAVTNTWSSNETSV